MLEHVYYSSLLYFHEKWLINVVKDISFAESKQPLRGLFFFFLVFIPSDKNNFGKCNMSTASVSQRQESCFALTLSSQSRQILSSCFFFFSLSLFPSFSLYQTNLFTSKKKKKKTTEADMSPGRIECLTDAHSETGAALFLMQFGRHRCVVV